MLILCHCIHCCLLEFVQCLSLPNAVPSVGSVSLFVLLSSVFCPTSVNSSHSPSLGFVSLCPQLSSTFLHYLSVRHILSPLVLCHTVHCSVQKSFHCLSEPYTPQSVNCLSVTGHFLSVIHTEPSFASVSLCPLVSSKIYPLSFSTSHCTACCSRVTMHSAIFCNMSKEWQYVTLFGLYVLCHHVH